MTMNCSKFMASDIDICQAASHPLLLDALTATAPWIRRLAADSVGLPACLRV